MRLTGISAVSYCFIITVLFISIACADDLNQYGCDFKDMEALYMNELGIDNVEVTYLIKRMDNPNTRGYARKTGTNDYLIALAFGLEESEKRVTLAHELVHVRQLENGSIDEAEFEKHYLDRSFEDEAFRLSMPMAIKFYTQHHCPDEPVSE